MNNKTLKILSMVSGVFLFLGCSMVSNFKQLVFLKQMGDNQAEIERYVERQFELFIRLQEDIKNNALDRGSSRNEVLYKYGDPVLCKSVSDDTDIKEVCLFRNPTKYFDTDMIYLKFDQDQRLCCWEYFQFGKK